MIQKDPNATDNALESLTEKDLVAKANTTLDLMGMAAANKPPCMVFVGAKKLKNGNVLYQLNSMDAGYWIQQQEVQKAFMANYRGTSNIQNKLHYVIAEFVPTTFDAGSSYAHAKVEEDSGISSNRIAFSKYIKPPHLRNENQKVAHVIFGFNDRNAANNAIQAGLFIEGKLSHVRKKLAEPRRCLKCQKYGHYVPDCKAGVDTCAHCGEQHRTSTCTVKDTAAFCCANCTGTEAKGHGAADRNCAKFKAECEKLQTRVPENKYKYFPTFIPSTWKLLNEPEHHAENQPQQWQQDVAWNRNRDNQENPQQFMENWQTVRRGRQQHRQQSKYQNDQQTANTRTVDNGWPVRPAQTTLDGYINHMATNEQQATHGNRRPTQQNTPWGDRDPNEQGPGPGPEKTLQNREHTPLEYV